MNAQIKRQYDGDEIDLRDLMLRLWNGRWWIIASVLLFSIVLTTAYLWMTPIYRAVVLLMPASSERGNASGSGNSALGQLGSVAALAGINVGSKDAETEEALAVLKSRNFIERFLSDEKLMPVLYASKWDASSGTWKGAPKKHPTSARAYRYFSEKILDVVQDKKTGLVTVQIDWQDRQAAAEWANKLIQRINAEMRARATAKVEASLQFLEKELASTSDLGTRDAINRLIESQVKQRMIANVTQEYVFRVVDSAMAPDVDDIVKPKKAQMLIGGPILGLAAGIIGVLVSGAFVRRPD